MCGLVGVVGKGLMHNHVKWFEHALYVDGIRGFDSTGIAIINKADDLPLIYKKAMVPSDFMDTRTYNTVMKDAYKSVGLLGHNRAATAGKIKHSTAHPFVHNHITLTHNGTLFSYYKLPEGKNFSVDSEAICYAISDIGVHETVKLLDGAYALAYHNSENSTFNMIRNDDRPLHYAYVKDKEVMLYASEAGMLQWLADKNDLELEEIIAVPEDLHLSFDLAGEIRDKSELVMASEVLPYMSRNAQNNWTNYYNQQQSADTGQRELWKYKGLEITFELTHMGAIYAGARPATVPWVGETINTGITVKVYNQTIDGFVRGAYYTGIATGAHVGRKGETVININPHTLEPVKSLPPADEEIVIDLDGWQVTVEEAKEALKNGCGFCSCDIPFTDIPDIMYYNQTDLLCKDCTAAYLKGELGEGN